MFIYYILFVKCGTSINGVILWLYVLSFIWQKEEIGEILLDPENLFMLCICFIKVVWFSLYLYLSI